MTGYTAGMSTELAEDSTPLTAKTGRRLALDVHAAVRAMILSGELAPGSPIPQAALARTLNVSRTPMREAFRLLQEEGLSRTGRTSGPSSVGSTRARSMPSTPRG